MSVRLVYEDIAVGAAEDATVAATGKTAQSDLTLIPEDNTFPNYATLETNLFALDGSLELYNEETVAYWSEALSDDNGAFSTPPAMTLTFTQNYTTTGITLKFSGDSYPANVNIKWYRGATQLDDKTFIPDALTYFCENNVEAYNKIVITFNAMSLPNRRLKISSVIFGVRRTFDRYELSAGSTIIQQEIDPTGRELPADTLDFEIRAKEQVEYIFQRRQPIYAYDGERLLGMFFIDESNRVSSTVYDITAVDSIGVLGDDPFPDARYAEANALSVAQSICGEFEVDMDASLQNQSISGVIVGATRRSALQLLCFRLNAVADTAGSDKIKIFPIDMTSPSEIPKNRARIGGAVKSGAKVTAVTVTAHSYSTSGSGDYVEINGTRYYDTKTTYTITDPTITAADVQNVVEVSDCTLIDPASLQAVTQNLYNFTRLIDEHDVAFRVESETVGDYVSAYSPWGTLLPGVYASARLVLSGITVANAKIMG